MTQERRRRRTRSRESLSTTPLHPYRFVDASGAWLIDNSGRRFFDGTSGSGAVGLGHQYPPVVEAVSSQLRRLIHTGCKLGSVARDDMIERLGQLAPFGAPSVLPTATGSEAVEAALKVARAATGKRIVVSFPRAFHGKTQGSLSLSQNAHIRLHSDLPPRDFGPHLPNTPAGILEFSRALAALFEEQRDRGGVAGLIVEPVQVTEGVHVVLPEALKIAAETAKANGALLILDEIHTSFARCGATFLSDCLNVVPDILIVGKALGNGFPIAAVLGEQETIDCLPAGVQTSTYSGMPLSAAAAVAVLDAMEAEALAERSLQIGRLLESALHSAAAAFPWVGDIRVKGALGAFDCVRLNPGQSTASRFRDLAADRGLLLFSGGSGGDTVKIVPPMLLNPSEIDFLESCLAETFEAVNAAG